MQPKQGMKLLVSKGEGSSPRHTNGSRWKMLVWDGVGTVGITQVAQRALGEVLFCRLPQEGARFQVMETLVTLEALKSVGEVHSPVKGEVIEVNPRLEREPALVVGITKLCRFDWETVQLQACRARLGQHVRSHSIDIAPLGSPETEDATSQETVASMVLTLGCEKKKTRTSELEEYLLLPLRVISLWAPCSVSLCWCLEKLFRPQCVIKCQLPVRCATSRCSAHGETKARSLAAVSPERRQRLVVL